MCSQSRLTAAVSAAFSSAARRHALQQISAMTAAARSRTVEEDVAYWSQEASAPSIPSCMQLVAARVERDRLANRVSLSIISSRLAVVARQSDEAFELDQNFDGGEWSGPESYRALSREIGQVLSDAGWSREEFEAELIARTSERWAFQSNLTSF